VAWALELVMVMVAGGWVSRGGRVGEFLELANK
jgi:hypothetical protein